MTEISFPRARLGAAIPAWAGTVARRSMRASICQPPHGIILEGEPIDALWAAAKTSPLARLAPACFGVNLDWAQDSVDDPSLALTTVTCATCRSPRPAQTAAESGNAGRLPIWSAPGASV